MKSKPVSVEKHAFSGNDKILVDANIWLYGYGPQADPKDRKTRQYSAAFKKILAAKSSIFVDVLIVSEFVNRYSRMEFQIKNPNAKGEGFKSFRKSAAFGPIAKAIVADLNRIFKDCKCLDTCFEKMNRMGLLSELEREYPDFNDLILAEICKSNGLMLLTHDEDFTKFDVPLLTANRNMLNG